MGSPAWPVASEAERRLACTELGQPKRYHCYQRYMVMADLLVRGVDDAIVQALKKRAGARGRSAEAEHRAILKAALLAPPRRSLAEVLAAIPDVGRDDDFARQPNQTAVEAPPTDVFD